MHLNITFVHLNNILMYSKSTLGHTDDTWGCIDDRNGAEANNARRTTGVRSVKRRCNLRSHLHTLNKCPVCSQIIILVIFLILLLLIFLTLILILSFFIVFIGSNPDNR